MGQTALQKLIEYMDNHSMSNTGTYRKAIALLHEENQGIVDAYDKGISDYCNYDPERHGNEAPSGIKYFNQKYSSEQDVKQKQ